MPPATVSASTNIAAKTKLNLSFRFMKGLGKGGTRSTAAHWAVAAQTLGLRRRSCAGKIAWIGENGRADRRHPGATRADPATRSRIRRVAIRFRATDRRSGRARGPALRAGDRVVPG